MTTGVPSVAGPAAPTRVEPAAAMTDKAASRVVTALSADGAEVRFVGGCVRDTLLGVPVRDVDLATPDRPEAVLALLDRAGLRALRTGLAHGTVTALAAGRPFEVTSLRVDVATDGRHARVAFTDDWHADAARRDFTFNAMSLGPDGTLHDYFAGRPDLFEGRVRFVGAPARRIAEDRLRVLRFFRFLAHYGRVEPDREALEACRDAAGELPRLSRERVSKELLRLLAAPRPVPALQAMAEAGVLSVVLPEAGDMTALAALTGIDDRDPLRRLAALVGPDGRAVADRLKMSNADRRRLAALAPARHGLDVALDREAQRRAIFDLGPELFRDRVLLAWAGDRDGNAASWRAMLDTLNGWEAPRLPLKGADIVALGVPEGPGVGLVLRRVAAWWRARDFPPDRARCLAEAHRVARELRRGRDP